MAMFGIALLLSFYYLGLYFLGKKEPMLLYIGFLCLLIVLKTSLIGERILLGILPAMHWALMYKLEMFSVYAGLGFFCIILYSLLPQEVDKWVFYIFFYFAVAACLIFIVLPLRYENYLLTINLYVRTLSTFYVFYVLYLAFKRKREGTVLLTLGYLALFSSVVADFFYFRNLTNITAVSAGVILFSICSGITVNMKMVKTEKEAILRREQMVHVEKLVSLGTLVAGVAHEINNPNNTIMLGSQAQARTWDSIVPILEEYAAEQGDFRIGGYYFSELKKEMPESFKRTLRNSERIKKIVEDLRAFARKDEGTYNDDVDVNEVVSSVLALMHTTIREHNVVVAFTPGKDMPVLKGNAQRLEQVLINLINNAYQAMTQARKNIFISTSHNQSCGQVVIAVRDEGRGMDSETYAHLFEPFFTTKGPREGSGLGLSICDRIVRKHGGKLEIESVIGKGTTVRIVLPVDKKNIV
jgi:signal transduction histidine kinase